MNRAPQQAGHLSRLLFFEAAHLLTRVVHNALELKLDRLIFAHSLTVKQAPPRRNFPGDLGVESAMKTALKISAVALFVGGALLATQSVNSMSEATSIQAPAIQAPAQRNLVRAPEFPSGLTWLNSDKPLSIKGLRGKVVLLDFWTYGCINCLHIIPDLKKLEAKYPNELVVIGVHSAKFATEENPENLRQAVMRYGLEHPVVSDKGMRIWKEYAIRAWPTQVLIDPDGRIVGEVMGEGNYDVLDKNIAKTIAAFGDRLDRTPLETSLERAKVAPTPLYFPGKVAAKNGRLVVADSSHNRLVVSDKSGKVEAIIGSGEAGLKDGDFQNAQFFNPQGVAIDGDLLYVADTNNHAIRRVDLKAKTVTTLAGTGQQAAWRSSGGVGTGAALASALGCFGNGRCALYCSGRAATRFGGWI